MNRLLCAALTAILMLAQLGGVHAAVCSNLRQVADHESSGHCAPVKKSSCAAGLACKQICDTHSLPGVPAQNGFASKVQLDWVHLPVEPISNLVQAHLRDLPEIPPGAAAAPRRVPIFLLLGTLLN